MVGREEYDVQISIFLVASSDLYRHFMRHGFPTHSVCNRPWVATSDDVIPIFLPWVATNDDVIPIFLHSSDDVTSISALIIRIDSPQVSRRTDVQLSLVK